MLAVRECVTPNGRVPFHEWLDTLDLTTRAGIQARAVLSMGNLGDHKMVASGVWEARIWFGPGYRISFGKQDRSTIILLTGGGKNTQARDIRRARTYWVSYLEARSDDQEK